MLRAADLFLVEIDLPVSFRARHNLPRASIGFMMDNGDYRWIREGGSVSTVRGIRKRITRVAPLVLGASSD